MMKKVLASLSILIILLITVMAPAYAAQVQEGYPYDDPVTYSYFMEVEESFNNKPDKKTLADAYYRYLIRVRDQKSLKILSVDRLELTFSGLPSYLGHTEEITKLNIPVNYHSTVDAPDKLILSYRDLDIRHYHSIDFELTSSPTTWKDYVESVSSRDSTASDISESSFMGYKALVVEDEATPFNNETSLKLSLHSTKTIHVLLEDAQIPNGVLIAKYTAQSSAFGEYVDSFLRYNEHQEEFTKYSKEFKDEVRKIYNDEKAAADSVLGSLSSIKPKIIKTVDMQVPAPKRKTISNVVIHTNAKDTPGEESASIPEAIVVGVISGAAALAAAGAAGAAGGGTSGAGGESGENPDEGQKSPYNMVISKNFGNAMKYTKTYSIGARITEEKGGVTVERPDLTRQISIFSNEILVGATVMDGVNMTAELKIQETCPPEGIVSFHFQGPLAYFQNNVKFKLLGKGQVKLATNKVSILSTDSKPYELTYELLNFEEDEPPAEITSSSGYVRLDLGKNDKHQNVLFILPGSDAENWDQESFTKVCKCEVSFMDDQLPVRTSFEVTVCFEGIGTAYEHLKINEAEKDLTVKCYPDAQKAKREEGAIWLPLTVMRWDEKARMLMPDSAKSADLEFAYAVDPDFEFNAPLARKNAEKFLSGANLSAQVLEAPASLSVDQEKKPSAYRIMADDNPAGGAAPFGMTIMVSCKKDAALPSLQLKAMIEPKPDFKGMVQWFLEYPNRSSVSQYLKLGDVGIYHAALDFIESRVYPISGVPWASNMSWLASQDSHYETGEDNILRKSYIAISDVRFPEGISENDFIKVQTLVHELTHVIEHQHRDLNVSNQSETNAYYLQYLSDIGWHLTDIEASTANLQIEACGAIGSFYKLYTDPEISGGLGNISTWFGARKLPVTSHQLFDIYAYHAEGYLQEDIPEAHREAISKIFRRLYFPANLSGFYFQVNQESMPSGFFVETDGPFKGAEWSFSWNYGALTDVKLTHSDYTFTINSYRWVGGNEMKVEVMAEVTDKKSSLSQDNLRIYVDCGTYDMKSEVFFDVRSFTTYWNSINDSNKSLLYSKTGLKQTSSWAERKK